MPGSPAPATLMFCPCMTPPPKFKARPAMSWNSGLHGGECDLWYFKPFKFLYRLPHTSHRCGFSFSIPSVPGYGADVSGFTIEKVPSALSCNCWLLWPCWKWISIGYEDIHGAKNTYSFVVFQTILVLVCLFATNDGASEWLRLFVRKESGSIRHTSQQLLFPDPSRDFTVRAVLSSAELEVRVRGVETSIRTKQSFRWFIDTEIDHVIAPRKSTKLWLALHCRVVVLHWQISKSTHHTLVEFGGCSRSGRIRGTSELRIL